MKRSSILYCCLVFIALSFLSSQAFGQHLHAFIVVDSDDKRIGNSVAIDGLNLTGLLQRGLAEDSFTTYVLSGKQVTAGEIVETMRNATIKQEDSVLFFYSGHGAFDRNTQGHFLTLNHSAPLARSTVKNAILAHNPNLTVMITDCCASIVDLPLPEPPGGGAGLAGGRFNGYPILRELFFNTNGLVDITSSRPGQVSLGLGNGGLFTNALLNTIETNTHVSMNWYDLFTKSRARASAEYESADSDHRARHSKGMADKQSTQTAWTFESMYGVDPNNQRLGLFMDLNQAGVITRVAQGSVAQVAGLEAGDKILSVNGNSFETTAGAIKMVGNSKRDMRLVVQCVRTGNHFQFDLKLPY